MPNINIKYKDVNGNEVVKKADVVTAYNKEGRKSIVLEFGELDGENKVVQVIYDNATGTYQAVPDGEDWQNEKGNLVACLRDQLPLEEYINMENPEETILVNISREDNKIGHPLALREANYLNIKGNYQKALQALRSPKVESVATILPKEEVNVNVQNISSGMMEAGIPDNSIVDMSSEIPKMEAIQNEPININNMIYTEMPVQEVIQNETPSIDTPKIEPTPVSAPMPEPTPIPEPIVVPEPTPFPPMDINSSIKSEEPSKIMEVIKTPTGMLNEVKDMPPIMDAPKIDNIVPFTSVASEAPVISDVTQNEKHETSAVEATYMESFEKSIAQMKEATEKMKSAHELFENAYKQIESAMEVATKTSENVKNVSHENYQQIQGRDAISRQTFENAQRMMNSQNEEEPTLTRAA